MIYFLILGFIFLLSYSLFYLYWPSRQGLPTFYPEYGFAFLIIASVSILIGLILYRRSRKQNGLSLFVSISLIVYWAILYFSQYLTQFVSMLRPDLTSGSNSKVIGFVIPTYTININLFNYHLTIPSVPYLHVILLVGIIGVLMFYKDFGEMKEEIKNILSKFNHMIDIEYKVSSIISFLTFTLTFLFFYIFSLTNTYTFKGEVLYQIMVAINNFFKLLEPITKLVGLYGLFTPTDVIQKYTSIDIIIILMITAVVSSLIFTLVMFFAFRRNYKGISREKINIRRNSVLLGLLVISLSTILVDVLFIFFFFNVPEGSSYFWKFSALLSDSLFTGMIYLEISLGITLVYKILKFANFAHSELVTSGGYIAFIFGIVGESIGTWNFFSFLGIFQWIPVFLMLGIISFFFSALLAYLLDLILFKPLRNNKASPITLMIASFALGLSLRMVLQQIFSANTIEVLPYTDQINLDSYILKIIIISAVLFTTWIFQILLYQTKYGKIMRAVSDNEDLAKVSGIKASRIHFLVWVIAGGFAGVAGLLFSSYPVGSRLLAPDVGFTLLLSAFAVAVLGGIGSFEGVVLASIIIGFSENFAELILNQLHTLKITFAIPALGFQNGLPFITNFVAILNFSQAYKIAVSYIILIIVLKIRPYGLLGEKPSGDR